MDTSIVDVEAQYAACLLAVGGPERLVDHITTAEYLFTCADWYDRVIRRNGLPFLLKNRHRPRPPRPFDRISDTSRNKNFIIWWRDYKVWLTENWGG